MGNNPHVINEFEKQCVLKSFVSRAVSYKIEKLQKWKWFVLIWRASCVHNAASLLKALFIFLFKYVPIDAFEHACVTFSKIGETWAWTVGVSCQSV